MGKSAALLFLAYATAGGGPCTQGGSHGGSEMFKYHAWYTEVWVDPFPGACFIFGVCMSPRGQVYFSPGPPVLPSTFQISKRSSCLDCFTAINLHAISYLVELSFVVRSHLKKSYTAQ